MRGLCLVSIGVLVVACADDPEPVALTSYVDALVAASCDRRERCGQVADRASCEAEMRFALRSDGDRVDAVIAGRATYDAERAGVCVEAVAAEACARGEAYVARWRACGDVFAGAVPQGGACDWWTDCAGASGFQSCTDPDPDGCPTGTCVPGVPVVGVGESCLAARCDLDSFCDASSVCRPRLETGIACAATDQCGLGQVCGLDTGTCGPYPGVGEPCERDWGCRDAGAWCSVEGDARTGVCASEVGVGQGCDLDLAWCQAGLICDDGVCVALPGLGEACEGGCAGDAFCELPLGTSEPARCVPRRADGEACLEWTECRSWACEGGVCGGAPTCS